MKDVYSENACLQSQLTHAQRMRPVRASACLIKATLTCRVCGRDAGEVVGSRTRPLSEARFLPNPAFEPPRIDGERWRCGHCAGALCLDDIEELAPSVLLSEIGVRSLAASLERRREWDVEREPARLAL